MVEADFSLGFAGAAPAPIPGMVNGGMRSAGVSWLPARPSWNFWGMMMVLGVLLRLLKADDVYFWGK